MTRPPENTAPRPKVSREALLLILLLVMAALIGAWYLWSNQPGDELSQPAPAPVTGEAGEGGTDPNAGPGEDTPGGSDTPAVPVQPDGQVDVQPIPPFPTDPDAAAAGEGEDAGAAGVPAGINPDTPLAGAPGSNPFRPLSLTEAAGSAGDVASAPLDSPAGSEGSSAGSASSGSGSGSDTGAVAAAPNRPADSGTSAGPVALSPIPVDTSPVSVGDAPVSGGPLAISIPGAPAGSSSSGNGPVVTMPGSPTPISVGSPISGGSPVAQTPGGPTPSDPIPAPPAPPVAGVRAPSVSTVASSPSSPLVGNVTVPSVGTSGSPIPGAAAGAEANLPTSVPTAGTPQAITELASGSAATALEAYVQGEGLAFNAVVLGPVNTAILRSKDGFVVVSTGQNLPDSSVVLKEVTATTATLALGNETKTLELDKR